MASIMKRGSLVLLVACSLVVLQSAFAEIICEKLPMNKCAFSISADGKRCVLENKIIDGGNVEYQCKTSELLVGSSTAEYIETDECVNACGVDRKSVGISSDSLLEPAFTSKLCSPSCYNNCPNIVDLYFNLAAGEGVYLPDMCNGSRRRRDMVEIQSSGAAAVIAPGPVSDEHRRRMGELAAAPAPVEDDVAAVPRRGLVELLSSGGGAAAEAPKTVFY